MNWYSRWTLILVLMFCIPATCAGLAAAPPNILFIYLDDFGWKDASYMGSDFFETPTLDRLASQGMVFTDAYSCAANCAPARACLLSGQYTPRHRIFNVGTRARGNPKHRRLLHEAGTNTLLPSIRTWAQQIRSAGYRTATIGKWHLSDDPRAHGFDINIAGTRSGSPPDGYYPPHQVPGLRHAPRGEYLTDRLSDEAVQFIRDNSDRPWLLYLTHFAVHTPLDAKRELLAKYQRKPAGRLHRHVAMATMIQAVDDGVARIQQTLDELELTRNTVVIFSSDNGGYFAATDMEPLRGCKGTYYEGGIRVPLFVKWPGIVAPGLRTSEPVIGVDLYPTLCEMTGASLPAGQQLDGRSLMPILTGRQHTFGERPLYWHFPAYLEARGAAGREARDPLFRTRPCSILRLGNWKLHQYFEDNSFELYNLADDLGERQDLSQSEVERTDQLAAQLRQWQKRVAAPIPRQPNPRYDPQAERAARAARQF